MKTTLICISLIFFFSGCATQGVSTKDYRAPEEIKVKNEITIDKSYNEVWDKLVKKLSKSFYVINNINKESRIINISYFTNNPKKYIDCGETIRTYKEGNDEFIYNYDTSENSKFLYAEEKQINSNFTYYFEIRRKTELEGRSNIYIAPVENDKNKTNVSVNSRYILSIKTSGRSLAKNLNGIIIDQKPIPSETYTIALNTNQVGTSDEEGLTQIRCYSRGTLENEILNMAK